MLQNVNPQQMYAPQMMPAMPEYAQQLPIPCVAQPPQAMQPGVMPVYNSIPYNPVYGNCCQGHQQAQAYSPKISTVSIELNGLEPPKVPGLNNQTTPMPVYPGMTQMVPQYIPYQTMQQPVAQIPQQVAMQPLPSPNPEAVNVAPPAPQYIQQPQQQVAPPPPAIDQAPKAEAPAAAPVNPAAGQQQDEAAVKPLLDALNVISPKQNGTEAPLDQQEKAIQTIAQFARVAGAASELAQKDPSNPEIKQTKEKVDKLIKPNLIKEETFLGLADIATKDTSKLVGEDKKKADENRVIGMWTLAMLQKTFKQEMNEEAKKINIPPISMNEVPGITQIVGIAQKDPNPDVREAGLAALVNLADPQDKKDAETMKAILTEAQKDQSENVKNAATEALKMYQPEPAKQEAPKQEEPVKK